MTVWRYSIIMRLRGGDVILDADDIERVIALGGWYVNKPNGYVVTNRSIEHNRLNRFIMGAKLGDPDVDHINRDKLDNRKSNLRFTTPAARSQNRTKTPGKTSKYMGVSWDKKAGKWRVRVGTRFYGYFTDEEEAARVAAEGRRTHHPYSTD